MNTEKINKIHVQVGGLNQHVVLLDSLNQPNCKH